MGAENQKSQSEQSLLVFCRQLFKFVQGTLDLLGRHAVRDTNVAGAAEAVAGDQDQVILPGPLAEGAGVRL